MLSKSPVVAEVSKDPVVSSWSAAPTPTVLSASHTVETPAPSCESAGQGAWVSGRDIIGYTNDTTQATSISLAQFSMPKPGSVTDTTVDGRGSETRVGATLDFPTSSSVIMDFAGTSSVLFLLFLVLFLHLLLLYMGAN